ncbi:hypothetical protein [Paenibacillus algicola]|uniref:hypothetical protein n=1 Tax=Paenibacillus algicola TaxID=2565926 RepID=UPI0010FED363|nr:hypothetical protein [Paenibacillus algicola]
MHDFYWYDIFSYCLCFDNSEKEGVIVKEYSYVDEEENIVLVQDKAYNPLSNGENSKLLAAAPNWNAKRSWGKPSSFQFHKRSFIQLVPQLHVS